MNIKLIFISISTLLRKYKKLVFTLFVFIMCFVTIFLSVYLSYSFYISAELDEIIRNAMMDEEYTSSISHLISKNDYEILNPRQKISEEGLTVKKEQSHTYPFVLPYLTDARYEFTYIVTDVNVTENQFNDHVVYAMHDSDVTLKLDYSVFPFKVVDVYIAP